MKTKLLVFLIVFLVLFYILTEHEIRSIYEQLKLEVNKIDNVKNKYDEESQQESNIILFERIKNDKNKYFPETSLSEDNEISKLEIEKIKLFYWKSKKYEHENFGDRLSYELVKRIVGDENLEITTGRDKKKKLLAIGSILHYANQGDVVWGSGMLNQNQGLNEQVSQLDIRSLRGPVSHAKLFFDNNIKAPDVYGDPALLVPYFFPEFKRSKNPKYEYIIIPHMHQLEDPLFDRRNETVVWPTENYITVINKILDSKFVISVSLHGIILAESFGIPARLLNHRNYFNERNSKLFKYKDHYYGTQRFSFNYANSIDEALRMGGEPPIKCDLEKLYAAFPKEFFANKLVYEKLPTIESK